MQINPMFTDAPAMSRKTRRPQFPFFIEAKPYRLIPFHISPVLPGETLKKAFIQSRTVSDPIKSDLLGWHMEKFFFYVKLTDLADREKFRQMCVDPDFDASAQGLTVTSADLTLFQHASVNLPTIPWTSLCLERVTQVYFRDDVETNTNPKEGSYPIVKNRQRDLFDSFQLSATIADPADIDVDLDSDGTTTIGEVERAKMMWMQQLMQGLTDKTFEDYLRSYGIRATREETNEPEVLGTFKEWTYPTRLVDTADGSPTAAVQWSFANSIDKAARFREPGFIFGVMCFRPKIYHIQRGSATGLATGPEQWLAGETLNHPGFGMIDVPASAGSFWNTSAAFRFDWRDLLLYGEGFKVGTTPNNVAMQASPAGYTTDYPDLASLDAAIWVAVGGKCRTDGMISLQIASHLQGDLTPST